MTDGAESAGWLHSGATLLNLALSGHPDHGWPLGRVSNVVGDASTGKSLMALQTLSVARVQYGDAIRCIYCESEATLTDAYLETVGMALNDLEVVPISTVEDLDDLLSTVCDDGKRACIVVDSIDALSVRDADSRGIDAGYNTGIAKRLPELFRRRVRAMSEVGVHLMLISQIRENLRATMPFQPRYRRSGGKALDFYATQIVWLSEVSKLKVSDTTVGIRVRAKVTKNKVAPPFRQVDLPLLFTYGFDDVGSMVDYLLGQKILRRAGGYVRWHGKAYRTVDLIHAVEESPEQYRELIGMVHEAWEKQEQKVRESHRRRPVAALVRAGLGSSSETPPSSTGRRSKASKRSKKDGS